MYCDIIKFNMWICMVETTKVVLFYCRVKLANQMCTVLVPLVWINTNGSHFIVYIPSLCF